MMKVIYAAYRHDPTDPDRGSSVDYGLYQAVIDAGMAVRTVGPFTQLATLPERILVRLHGRLTGRRFSKFHLSLVQRASRSLNVVERSGWADVILTMFPTSLAGYKGRTPAVYVVDATYQAANREYPGYGYGRLASQLDNWIQLRALARSAHIITHSAWCRHCLIEQHGVASDRITVFAMPSAIPEHIVPKQIEVTSAKRLEEPLRLLFVGRDAHRKGLDIALEIVDRLEAEGAEVRLTVCGLVGPDRPNVRFTGILRKSDPEQLARYAALYERAHLLLHPARFEPAGIVPSEAAAFATPTITNDVGGLATTVEHGISGLVLPRWSPPAAYVKEIVGLARDQARYYALCKTARQRYERELNWRAAGVVLADVLQRTAGVHSETNGA